MIGLALIRWLLVLAALVLLGMFVDRLLIWLDRRDVVRYRAGRRGRTDDRGSRVRPVADRFRQATDRDRAPEGFPDDPFPAIDLEEEEEGTDEEPPDNVYPFH